MKIRLLSPTRTLPLNRSAGALRLVLAVAVMLGALAAPSAAQSCRSGADLDPATRASLDAAAAQHYHTAQQNPAALKPAADFDVEDSVASSPGLFQGQASTRAVYLIENAQGGQRGEFFCGVYRTPTWVVFVFNGLPAGRFGIVIQDVAGKARGTVSWVLRQSGAQWRVAGLIPKPGEFAGHDGNWFLAQARAFHSKGQNRNAWLYYSVALDLLQPMGAMNTVQLERLYEEAKPTQPADLPVGGQPVDLAVEGRTFRLTLIFATAVGTNIDLVVKYQEPDVTDTSKAFQSNMALIKGLSARYPELRSAFAAIIARAVTPAGQEYGTLVAVADIK